MELGFTHKAWEKWASHNIGSSKPLKVAMLLNYDPTCPSHRFQSCKAEQRGIIGKPVELVSFLDYVKRNNLPGECFVIGSNQCKSSCIVLHSSRVDIIPLQLTLMFLYKIVEQLNITIETETSSSFGGDRNEQAL
ncbi:hypothetical protein IFM89_025877, partial [Coptis chinensis]